MLRTALLVASLAVAVIGLGAGLGGHADAWPAAFWGGVVTAAVLVERWRYRTRQPAADAGWQATSERFIDPGSGQAMQVLFNPRTGERRYVAAVDGREGPA